MPGYNGWDNRLGPGPGTSTQGVADCYKRSVETIKILHSILSILLSSVAVLAAGDTVIIKTTTVIDGKGNVLKDLTLARKAFVRS